MPRRALTISLIRAGLTPIFLAIRLLNKPKGSMNSCSKISPGCTSFSRVILISLWRPTISTSSARPFSNQKKLPLVVNTETVLTLPVSFQRLQTIVGWRTKHIVGYAASADCYHVIATDYTNSSFSACVQGVVAACHQRDSHSTSHTCDRNPTRQPRH